MRHLHLAIILATLLSVQARAEGPRAMAERLEQGVVAAQLARWTAPQTTGTHAITLADQLGVLYLHALAIGRAGSDGERDRLRRRYDQAFDQLLSSFRDPSGEWHLRAGLGGRPYGKAGGMPTRARVIGTLADVYRLVSDARARSLAVEASGLPGPGSGAPATDRELARALCRLFPVAPTRELREQLLGLQVSLGRQVRPGRTTGSAAEAEAALGLHWIALTLHQDPAPAIRLMRRVADKPGRRGWSPALAMVVNAHLYAATHEPRYLALPADAVRVAGGISPAGSGELADAAMEASGWLRESLLPPLPYHRPRARPRRAVQVDAGFAYYRGRSAESVISEVKANGFDCIHLVCTGADLPMPGLVDEAHRQGVEVWATFFPTGVYMPDAALPRGFEAWRMQLSTNQFADYRFFSYVYPGYRAFWKRHLADVCGKHRPDGMLFYEVHYPTMNGPTQYGPRPTFSDISPGFRRAFRRATGRDDFPNFTDPSDPHYYRTDRGLFDDFVEFRIQSIMEFQHDVLDGDGGFRRLFPGVMFATWTIALSHPRGLAAMRENESQDPARLVAEFAPDAHILQSHAPDWGKWDQVPAYVDGYEPYCRAVHSVFPETPLGLQADVGSTLDLRRTPDWMREVEDRARRLGMVITTYYEFGLRWELYHAAPVVHTAEVRPDGQATITFDQRIAPASCSFLEGAVLPGGQVVRGVKVDGNLLRFRVEGVIGPTALGIPVGGITSDPSVGFAMPGKGVGIPHAVAAGQVAMLRQGQAQGQRRPTQRTQRGHRGSQGKTTARHGTVRARAASLPQHPVDRTRQSEPRTNGKVNG